MNRNSEIEEIKEAIIELRNIIEILNPSDTWQKHWFKLNNIIYKWKSEEEE